MSAEPPPASTGPPQPGPPANTSGDPKPPPWWSRPLKVWQGFMLVVVAPVVVFAANEYIRERFFADCVSNSVYVGDPSVPAGTRFPPGATFVMKWRLANPDAPNICTWGKGYNVVWTGDENIGDRPSFDVPETKPGEEAVVSVPMTAPTTPGPHKSTWILRDPYGIKFGDRFWAEIVVEQSNQAAAEPLHPAESASGEDACILSW